MLCLKPLGRLACLCLVLLAAGPARADLIQVTPIGTPAFSLADVNIFTGPVGTAADGYHDFNQTVKAILNSPTNYMANLGLKDSTTFPASAFTSPNGVYLVFMVEPISQQTTTFPLTFSGTLSRNGVLYDPAFDPSPVPTLNGKYVFPHSGTGWSPIPIVAVENTDFGAPGTPVGGNYQFQFTLLDAHGNGYQIQGSFNVAPEPGSLALSGIGLLGLLGWAARRRLLLAA
jgi:hypothetical protein